MRHTLKNAHLSMCIRLARSKFSKHRVSNTLHFWSIQRVFYMFVCSNFRGYFDPPYKNPNKETVLENEVPASKFRTSRPPKGVHSDQKKGAPTHFRFWVTHGGPGQAANPVPPATFTLVLVPSHKNFDGWTVFRGIAFDLEGLAFHPTV